MPCCTTSQWLPNLTKLASGNPGVIQPNRRSNRHACASSSPERRLACHARPTCSKVVPLRFSLPAPGSNSSTSTIFVLARSNRASPRSTVGYAPNDNCSDGLAFCWLVAGAHNHRYRHWLTVQAYEAVWECSWMDDSSEDEAAEGGMDYGLRDVDPLLVIANPPFHIIQSKVRSTNHSTIHEVMSREYRRLDLLHQRTELMRWMPPNHSIAGFYLPGAVRPVCG